MGMLEEGKRALTRAVLLGAGRVGQQAGYLAKLCLFQIRALRQGWAAYFPSGTFFMKSIQIGRAIVLP